MSFLTSVCPHPESSTASTSLPSKRTIRVILALLISALTSPSLTGWLSALKARIRPLSLGFNFICIIVITILIVLITRPAKTYELCPAGAPCLLAACPFDWIGYQGKCYYFSELEANWTESQKNCSALGASLAGIDLQWEMLSAQEHHRVFYPTLLRCQYCPEAYL
nr:C-type lectin domain family 2 member D5-like [Pelodiscus sinensis]|eukprot:XP_014432971.1 C-type lectin domain family 2 member D5-like [Pelodiscus sinensis]